MSAVLEKQPVKQRLTGGEFIKIATVYARKVVRQKYQCRTMKLACQRYLDDLKKQKKKEFPYYLSPKKVAHVCWFMEMMPHIKGDLSKLPFPENLLKLEPWQVFIFVNIFGWLKKENDFRRFTEAYVKVPRKNGKSPMASGIGNYMFAADGEPGAEVCAGASSKDQANAVFEPALAMVEKMLPFQKRFDVQVNAWNMRKPDASIFHRLVGNPGDGGNIHCAIVDEYHEHKKDKLFETMKTGTVARSQPLVFVITTAGVDTSYPCYAYEKECINNLENGFKDELFVAIWGVDNDEDWKVLSWVKAANPNYGVSVKKDILLAALADAKRTPRKRSIFQQKHCNIWTSGEDAYFNMEHWNSSADASLKESDFTEDEYYPGLDLASKIDIASDVRIYKREVDGVPNFYIFGNHYVPEAVRDDPDFQKYHDWIDGGHLIATRGNKIDHFEIAKNIFKTAKNGVLKLLGYDNDNAAMLISLLEKGDTDYEGIDIEKLVDVPQRRKHLSDAMKWLEGELKAGTVHHDDNPVMNWMMSNVMVSKRDYLYDNFFPIKSTAGNKIDGPLALLTGAAVMNSVEEENIEVGVAYI